jgi:Zn-dependent alcohol dehydrogenase
MKSSRPRFEGRTTRAAVMRAIDGPLQVEVLEIAEPGPGEVLVRLGASGVCHSDLHVWNGDWPGVPLPIVLGHEGAGVVEEVGSGVDRVARGDAVVLSHRNGRPRPGEGPRQESMTTSVAEGVENG